MYLMISIVAALLLAACGDDRLDDRDGKPPVVVPRPDAFPTGKWIGSLISDHAAEPLTLFAGIHGEADAREVVLRIERGPVHSFPARQEGAFLVVENASLRDGVGCRWSYLDFERITFRMVDGRLAAEGTLSWEEFEDDYFKDVRHGVANFIGSPLPGPPVMVPNPYNLFHAPPGKFAASVAEPVLLPDEVTIELDGDEFAGTVEGGGTWGLNLNVVPHRALPWGSKAVAHAEVLGAAGLPHTLSFELPTVAAPAAAPDPLLSTLDGYATVGLRPLPSSTAAELLGRDTGFAVDVDFGWVLAFEAEVPDDASARLEIDLVDAISDDMGFGRSGPLVATIASTTSTPEERRPILAESQDRTLPAGSEFNSIGDATLVLDLSAYRGDRVYISLSAAAVEPACIPWMESRLLTALKRIEVVP